ncbi:MAG: ABC transporter permease, partial [Anaerolineales bacterium]
MRNLWTITKREYVHYFVSPMAYAIALLFLAILGLIFLIGVTNSQQPNATAAFGPMLTIFLFFAPALTMRLLADEQRSGTLELLLTSPVREWELVLGKWLGAWLFSLTLIATTAIYPLILRAYGNPDL